MAAASKIDRTLFTAAFGWKMDVLRKWTVLASQPASQQLPSWVPKFGIFLPAEPHAELVKIPLWGVDNQPHRQ